MLGRQPTRWAVVGGGVLGMTLAHRLAQRGGAVTLLEAADHLGGLADAWRLGDIVWDRHYHVILLSDAHLRRLLTELNLESEIEWGETKTGFFVDGQLYSLSNTWEFLRFPPLGLLDKLRLAATILQASRRKDARRLEHISACRWLRRWSGRRTFEKIWLPLLRAKLGDRCQTASAAFIWATIARMYAARRTGLKKEMFGCVSGGYARVLDCFQALLSSEGVDIRLGSAVRKVTAAPGGVVRLDFDRRSSETFDRVILTAPASLAATLCPQLDDDEKARLRGVQYLGVVCASLLLQRPLTDYYITNIADESIPFTGAIEMTALVDRSRFGGRSLVYLPKYAAPDDPLFERPDEEIKEQFVAGLERLHPGLRRDDLLTFQVSRARRVMAIPTLDYSQRLPPMETSVPGVYLVNSSQIVNGTLNVNETIRLADEALRRLLPKSGGDAEGALSEKTHHDQSDRQLVAGP